ncbi:hypothetical protein [Arachidicoccus soli]|uniref:Uncharacterized protein n=1 Tax=Arachidicoccus soli TaxID=2341117 RepID=A0A386HQS6_9BACT|nr:hypothetical protein [Arachidicoccus soli]AYD48205.1 hypothetical protein D6B99_11715 [Arachidicoccus soli]
MTVENSYPELPVLPFERTSVSMDDVIAYLQSLTVDLSIKIAAYVMFRQESANGQSGVNNNYLGIQADSGRWADYLNSHLTGTVVKDENMTGQSRRFLAFDSFEGSIDFLIDRIKHRGLFVGGTTSFIIRMQINSPAAWAIAYWRTWVEGDANAQIPDDDRNGLLSMYKKGQTIFN